MDGCQKISAAGQAGSPSGAEPTTSRSNNKSLVVGDAPAAGAVARLAGWYEVVVGVVKGIAVDVICHERAAPRTQTGHPHHFGAAPVAWV
jgi:hypothetical protein